MKIVAGTTEIYGPEMFEADPEDRVYRQIDDGQDQIVKRGLSIVMQANRPGFLVVKLSLLYILEIIDSVSCDEDPLSESLI